MAAETVAQRDLSDVDHLIGGKDILKSVVQKLSSQLLLFSVAVVVFVLTAFFLFDDDALVVSLLILFVFLAGGVGYLFFEEKRSVERREPEAMSRLLGNQVAHIVKPAASNADFTVDLEVLREAAAGSRDIAVKPATGGAFHIGDHVNLRFRASCDCYLTLLNIGTSGKLTVLFPNGTHTDNRIRGGEWHEIPGDSYGFDYVLQGPPGTERLKAVATLEKVALLESSFAPDGSLFRQVESTAAARDIAIVQKKTDVLPADAWTEAYCEFDVVP